MNSFKVDEVVSMDWQGKINYLWRSEGPAYHQVPSVLVTKSPPLVEWLNTKRLTAWSNDTLPQDLLDVTTRASLYIDHVQWGAVIERVGSALRGRGYPSGWAHPTGWGYLFLPFPFSLDYTAILVSIAIEYHGNAISSLLRGSEAIARSVTNPSRTRRGSEDITEHKSL